MDPEKAKAESEAKAWAEFSEFAGGVARDEAQDEATNLHVRMMTKAKRRALDRAWYERRLAPLMARRRRQSPGRERCCGGARRRRG